ncbi:hypothetical protein JXO59_16415 [candidate division KSB1 bacterium]|nr:hypothetical protein [candidate division KSB1 bacterium]
MKQRVCIIALLSLLSTGGYSVKAQVIETVTVDFTKISTRHVETDTVRGKICYQDGKITLKVVDPLQQWMVLHDIQTLIYYPQESRAIRIISENTASLPFFQSFLSLGQDYNNLEKLGFVINKTESRGDTLISYWSPAKTKKGQGGQFILKVGKNRLYVSEFKDFHRNLFYRTVYDDFFVFGRNNIPLRMTSHYKSDRDTRTEMILFENPVINQTLPDEFLQFDIPASTEIKEIKW